MKTVLAWLLLAVVALVGAAEQKYTTKYDNINVNDILNNDRLYNKYLDCLANKGKCTPEGQTLKDIIPDALRSRCSKCHEHQKKDAETVIRYMIEKKPKDFDLLESIYDPEGTYRSMYKKEAAQRGIKI